jgi:hypothetical protein
MSKITMAFATTALILAGVGAWAASATRSPFGEPTPAQLDPAKLMMNTSGLPSVRYVDYSVVFN